MVYVFAVDMQELISQLAQLTLTLVGFSLAIFGIVVSLFSRGILLLKNKYSHDFRENTEQMASLKERIRDATDKELDDTINSLKTSLSKSKNLQKKLRNNLSYLRPGIILSLTVFPLAAAYILLIVISPFTTNPLNGITAQVFLPLYLGLIGIFIFYFSKTINIVIEAKDAIDKSENEEKKQQTDLLREISINTNSLIKLSGPVENINILIDGTKLSEIKDGIVILLDQITKLKVELSNSDDKIAELVEMGFILPQDFTVAQVDGFSYFVDSDGSTIVRYNRDEVHSRTRQILSNPLTFTPKLEGKYKINCFIKGKNITPRYQILNVTVVMPTNNRVL